MFRFQNPYESSDPFFLGGYRPQPARRQAHPYEEIFGGYPGSGVYGGGYGGYPGYAEQQEELRRQQLEKRRREEELYIKQQEALRQEQEKRTKAKLERERARKAMIAKANKAATVIQRAVRKHLAVVRAERAKVQAEREDKASRVVVRAVRHVAAVKEARRIAESLRKLRTIDAAIKKEFETFQARPCGYRNTLRFIDTVEKRIISLDSVPRHRSTFVQERRRAIITDAQRALHYGDFVQKMLSRKAAIVQRATRRFLQAKHQAQRERAAKVIVRAIRAYPLIRKARAMATKIRAVREESRRLDQARALYLQALKDAQASLEKLQQHQEAEAEAQQQGTLTVLSKALRERAERDASFLSQ